VSFRDLARAGGAVTARACPNGHPDHQILEPDEETLTALGLPPGSLLHVDDSREPRDGELVWVELVRLGSTERLVRRYSRSDRFVTLTVLAGNRPAIMRRLGELLVLGVVEAMPPPAG
jgi:hypothetical protein